LQKEIKEAFAKNKKRAILPKGFTRHGISALRVLPIAGKFKWDKLPFSR